MHHGRTRALVHCAHEEQSPEDRSRLRDQKAHQKAHQKARQKAQAQ